MSVHQTRYLGDAGDGHEFVCPDCNYHERLVDGELVTLNRGDATVRHVGSTTDEVSVGVRLDG